MRLIWACLALASAAPAAAAPDPDLAAWLAEGCAACHAAGGGAIPALKGHPAPELKSKLDDYASGARDHALMGALARSLSPEERAAVAAWLAAQPGETP